MNANRVKVLIDPKPDGKEFLHADLVASTDGYALINTDQITGYNNVRVTDSDGDDLFTNIVAVEDHLIQPADWWVNVYEVSQGYGGPEEGGWWYTCGELVESNFVGVGDPGMLAAQNLANQLRDNIYPDNGTYTSVVYTGGDYRIEITNCKGRNFPTHHPHYE